MQRFWNIYFPKFNGDVCQGLKGKPIGFENSIGAFLVLGTGIGAAILVLITENIFKRVLCKKPDEEMQSTDQSTSEPAKQQSSESDIEVASIEDVGFENK